MQIRIVSRLWLCGRPWRLKFHISRNSVHFRKSNICAIKLHERNKLQTRTAQQKLDLFLWMLVCERTGVPRFLDSVIEVSNNPPYQINKSTNPKFRSHREACRLTPHFSRQTQIQPSTSVWIWIMWITFRPTWVFRWRAMSFVFSRTLKPWLRRSSKAGVQQWVVFVW